MATYEVKGIFSICLILCVLEGSYFLLFWHNKQIIFTWIIYRSIFGIEKIHIEDVIKLCKNNICNKYLTPNKNIKIMIKNKKIFFTRYCKLP